jgi:natural product biosynthesis luciferase-like monooxygenase protein
MNQQKDIFKNLTPTQRELLMLRMNKANKNSVKKHKIEKKSKEGIPAPLSFAQIRLWFLEQLDSGNPTYNMPAAIKLTGSINIKALEKALNEIIRRHQILRTTFGFIDETPMQTIAPHEYLPFNIDDLTEVVNDTEKETKFTDLIKAEAVKPFDLSKSPLLRVKIIKLKSDQHIVLLTIHHIVSDGWSMGILINEFTVLYDAFSKNNPSPLPELVIQYADFSIWQRETLQGGKLEEEITFWKENLAGSPRISSFPTDFQRPPIQSFRGSAVPISFEQELSNKVKLFAQEQKLTNFMVLAAVLKFLMSAFSGQSDIVLGTPIAGRKFDETESLIGLFLNNLVLRTQIGENESFQDLLVKVKDTCLNAYSHQDLPFEKLVEELSPQRTMSHAPLFQVMFSLQADLNSDKPNTSKGELQIEGLATETGTSKFDVTFQILETTEQFAGVVEYSSDLYSLETIEQIIKHFINLTETLLEFPNRKLRDLELLSKTEHDEIVYGLNQTAIDFQADTFIDELIKKQSDKTPDSIAIVFGNQSYTFDQLEKISNQIARYLSKKGVSSENLIGIHLHRSAKLIPLMLGVLKTGGGYVPLDPAYPLERLKHMVEDSGMKIVVTDNGIGLTGIEEIDIEEKWEEIEKETPNELENTKSAFRRSDQTAYMIYTSGSTGKPKGVVISHRNVVNFFKAMDEKLGFDQSEVWLAVTSISFDISVLELFWTLTHGAKVVIQKSRKAVNESAEIKTVFTDKTMEFSLFYFANDEITDTKNSYQLLLEGAKYADQNGFKAVWTPERHFHSFGAIYPSPAITNAALSTITQNIELRAGSVVLPLHNVVRVAEEWAVIDLLSHGRAGISFASGWHSDDFIFAPEKYENSGSLLYEDLDKFKSLWKGEKLKFKNGKGTEIEIQTFPRPLNEEIPIWITSSGNPETFRLAGEKGYKLLTHFLVQNNSELEEKIKIYRNAWKHNSGKSGEGHVTLMIHTFISDNQDFVAETVREPFKNYLRGSLGLMKNLFRGIEKNGEKLDFSLDDIDALLEFSFNRYYRKASLMGTVEDSLRVISTLKSIGVDEVACLIDFGIEHKVVLENLKFIKQVMELTNKKREAKGTQTIIIEPEETVASQIKNYQITHLQCTPSLIRMLSFDENFRHDLPFLKKLLLGGEAISPNLINQLKNITDAKIYNMYGPTETTIWSTTEQLDTDNKRISIGQPIANTEVYILNKYLLPVPYGLPGEIYIGGEGVARGYQNRPDLTASKFIPNPFKGSGTRLYQTGDQAIFRPNGKIEFLGRQDNQVKIRGFRIELGEIESVLENLDGINRAIVTADTESDENIRLIAYLVGQNIPEPASLRELIREKLPEFMIPAIFIKLAEFPLTPNGKIDRKNLPQPGETDIRSKVYIAPENITEEMLAKLWSELLRVEKVGTTDNFFDLGGHSLLATLLLSRIQKTFSVELPLRIIFEKPTVADQADLIIKSQVQNLGEDSFAQLSEEIADLSEEEIMLLLNEEKSVLEGEINQ